MSFYQRTNQPWPSAKELWRSESIRSLWRIRLKLKVQNPKLRTDIVAAKSVLLSHGLADLASEAKVEDPLGRHRLLRFDSLGRDRDHFPLHFFIYDAG